MVVTGGVDTHKDVHAVAALDGIGRVLGTETFPTTVAGQADLIAWLASHGPLGRVGVEGTGSWGKNLARSLDAAGVEVIEVQRPSRQHIRRHGKSDPTDAIAAARSVLADNATRSAKTATGPGESVRLLRAVRSSAIKARTAWGNQIHAVVATAPDTVRAQLRDLKLTKLVDVAARFGIAGALTTPDAAARWSLRQLARRYQTLTGEIADVDSELATVVAAAAPPKLLREPGIGIDVAGAIVTAVGDNPQRLATDATFAALAGTSPLDASSGKQRRHRLNRGGNRELNNAIWRVVMVRLRWDDTTKAYMARRTAEGKTKKEIVRCLKRYVARRIWTIYRDHLSVTNATPLAA
jgi:transposase